LIRAAGRHYARHAGRFCFWSSATRVRLSSPIGQESLHTQPCGLRLGVCAPFGIARNGDLPGVDFPSGKKEQRDVIQAQLLCCRRTGGVGGGGHSSCSLCAKYEYGLPPFHPIPIPISSHFTAGHGGAGVSITLVAPVVRIAGKSCDRTFSGRIDAVLPWWPRSCCAASNGSWGKM
jgi:hypothetical protein